MEITINGEHNDFPAYELLVDNKSIYSYNPADHGYTGPNPHNLNVKRKFTTKLQTRVSDLEIKDSLIKNKKKGIGY